MSISSDDTLGMESELERRSFLKMAAGVAIGVGATPTDSSPNTNLREVVAGLEKDYLANSFGPMPQIMVDAEYITKVNAICMKCGDPANFSHRISSEKKQVVVGEIDKYEALCRTCYQKVLGKIK